MANVILRKNILYLHYADFRSTHFLHFDFKGIKMNEYEVF